MSSDAPAPRLRPHSRLSLARSLKLAQLLVFEKVVELLGERRSRERDTSAGAEEQPGETRGAQGPVRLTVEQ